MKTIRILCAILVLHMVTGCAFNPQAIELQPTVHVTESSIGHGRVVYVDVVDERPRTTLGTRGAGIGADLTLKGDLSSIVRSSTIGGLTRQGFSPTMEAVPDVRELRVEIRNLNYEVRTGFWAGTLRTTCSLKAICRQDTTRMYEKLHRGDFEASIQVVQSDERNNQFVNTAVSKALNSMLGDESLMACLAEPPHVTSASAGAAAMASGAASKQPQASMTTVRGKQYSTDSGKTVAESLAALKVLHEQGVLNDEEYMQKQREIVNVHTENKRGELGVDRPTEPVALAGAAAAGISGSDDKRFRAAVFPIANLVPQAFGHSESALHDYAREYIESHPSMALVYSDNDERFESGRAGTVGVVWRGTMTDKSPNKSVVADGAKHVGANVAVLLSLKKRTAGWYGDDFLFDVYLIDTDTGRTYHLHGDELNFEKIIDSAFERLTAQ